MFAIVCTLLVMVTPAQALYPGFTTAGTHFVLSNIKYEVGKGHTDKANIHVTSEYKNVAVEIKGSGKLASLKKKFTVSINSPYTFSFDKKEHFEIKLGVNDAFYIISTLPIFALHEIFDSTRSYLSTLNLLPKQSCRQLYYFATPKTYPLIKVHSFNKPTKLVVKFPSYAESFNIECGAEKKKRCTPKSEVTVELKAYNLWHLHLMNKNAELHGTRIESNEPVFVVSGSFSCILQEHGTEDYCLSSVPPLDAWGNQYIIPNLFGSNEVPILLIRLTATKFPFHYKRIEKNVTFSDVVNKNKPEAVYKKMTEPIVLRSNMPFALYMFLSSKLGGDSKFKWDVAMTRLVPVEQWMRRMTYIPTQMDTFTEGISYIIFTTADPKSLIISGASQSPKWKRIATVDKLSYWEAYFDLGKTITTISINGTAGKIMIYAKFFTNKYKWACGILAYKYYQGIINTLDCVKVLPVVSDGVDNDCDGHIDEEIANGEDDDGDGEVDEDTVESYRDGEWAEWIVACDVMCGSKSIGTHRIRSCSRSQFGKVCKGKEEMCGSGAGSCKETCPTASVKPTVKCVCQDGCTSCNASSPNCKACKSGYFDTPFCHVPCPLGRGGNDCRKGPRTYIDFQKIENYTKSLATTTPLPNGTHDDVNVSFSWIWLVLPVLFIFFVLGMCCLLFVFKKKKEGSQSSPQKDSKDDRQSQRSEKGDESADAEKADIAPQDQDEAEQEQPDGEQQNTDQPDDDIDDADDPTAAQDDEAEQMESA